MPLLFNKITQVKIKIIQLAWICFEIASLWNLTWETLEEGGQERPMQILAPSRAGLLKTQTAKKAKISRKTILLEKSFQKSQDESPNSMSEIPRSPPSRLDEVPHWIQSSVSKPPPLQNSREGGGSGCEAYSRRG